MSRPSGLKYFRLPFGKKGPPLAKKFWEIAVPWEEFDRGTDLDGRPHNIGVSTTGMLVLDVDAHKGGLDSLAALEMTYGTLPPTYTVATPSGGKHIYFWLPPGKEVANSREKLGKGLDVRGFHGYVVGAGSVLDNVEISYEVASAIEVARYTR